MIKSLFNQVQLFDFLAVFLKKLLKKKYLKEIVNEQYKNLRNQYTYKRGESLQTRMFDGTFNQILNFHISSSKKYFRKFKKNTQKDFTKKRKLQKKKRKYEELVNNIYKMKNSGSKNYNNTTINSSNLGNGSREMLSILRQNINDEPNPNLTSISKPSNPYERAPDSNFTNFHFDRNTSCSGKFLMKRTTFSYF
jgi:hypothetical protein